MRAGHGSYEIVDSAVGRVVVPSGLPDSLSLFWTTLDFDGRLHAESVESLLETAAAIGRVPSRLETCTQVHGTSAVRVDTDNGRWNECSDCDALWTRESGVGLAIKIADCLPVSIVEIADDQVTLINLHAGWRGAAAGIVPSTIANAREDAVTPERTLAWLGPSIRVCCFEVGEEVVDAFRELHPYVDEFIDRSQGKPHLDLAGIVTRSLVESGVPADSVWDGGLCTRCPDSMFHSYRRSGPKAGRNLAVIAR